MKQFLQDNFDFFDYLQKNRKKLELLRDDAQSALGEAAYIRTTSIAITAALINNKDRIVRDDLPLPLPKDQEMYYKCQRLADTIGKWLTCCELEENGTIQKTDDGWELTEKGKQLNKTIEDLIKEKQFPEDTQ